MNQQRNLLLTFGFILSLNFGYCTKLDTITNWQIYYDGELVTAGHDFIANQKIGTLKLKKQPSKLQVYYSYDFAKPEWRTIKMVCESDTLYNETQHLKDNHPHLIDLNELFENRKGTFQIKIYYTDDITTEKNRLIGTIKLET